ncbi:hypothetical protein CKO28_02755 [Rhodovibrio sodomensis]|uniref:Uncharacterized protein n=1 Tax=Rhodovibrio sodomensis TaxID=1088 RepID=A0ABS1DBL9_9PROT|nr:hypothetical protein [Rhodovibrio sodomensis]
MARRVPDAVMVGRHPLETAHQIRAAIEAFAYALVARLRHNAAIGVEQQHAGAVLGRDQAVIGVLFE